MAKKKMGRRQFLATAGKGVVASSVVAGFPAISIPLAARDGALPAALQIVAKPGGDAALLQVALQMEQMLRRVATTTPAR